MIAAVFRTALVLGLTFGALPFASPVEAAEPALTISAARLRIFVVRKGDNEVVNFGQLDDTATADRFIVLLVGTGNATLTVSDAEATGDTINAAGSLVAVFPTAFDQSATSPASIQQNCPVLGLGLLTFDVQYETIVNTVPARYFFQISY